MLDVTVCEHWKLSKSRLTVGCVTLCALSILAAPSYAAVDNHTAVLEEPTHSIPAVGNSYNDPSFGTEVLRALSADDVVAGERMGPEYSQLQVWNADQSLMLLGGDRIVDANTFEIRHQVRLTNGFGSGLRWSPVEPMVMYYTGFNVGACAGAPLMRYVLTPGTPMSGESQLVRCFPEYTDFNNDASYEELSNDGRFVALVGQVTAANHEIFAYDLIDDVKHTPLPVAESQLDWAAMSPSGNYVLVLGPGAEPQFGLDAYDLEMNHLGKVHTGFGHSDIVMDRDGVEWAVVDNSNNSRMFVGAHYIVKARIPDGVVYTGGSVDEAATLASGSTVLLLQLDWSQGIHISCRNILAPDWCVVTTESESAGAWVPMQDEIIRLYLTSTSESVQVERLAHHRSSLAGYWETPFATASPDGARIVFGSDRETTTGIDPYIVLDAAIQPPGSGGFDDGGSGTGGSSAVAVHYFVLLLAAVAVRARRRHRTSRSEKTDV